MNICKQVENFCNISKIETATINLCFGEVIYVLNIKNKMNYIKVNEVESMFEKRGG